MTCYCIRDNSNHVIFSAYLLLYFSTNKHVLYLLYFKISLQLLIHCDTYPEMMYTHILFIHLIKGIPLEGRRNGYLTHSIQQLGREHTLEGRGACPIHQHTWKGENNSERESHTSFSLFLFL